MSRIYYVSCNILKPSWMSWSASLRELCWVLLRVTLRGDSLWWGRGNLLWVTSKQFLQLLLVLGCHVMENSLVDPLLVVEL